jgi:hypothetical protein
MRKTFVAEPSKNPDSVGWGNNPIVEMVEERDVAL